MGLSRKRKKELRRLQDQATKVWESQQVLVGEAAAVAREAGRQLGHYNREHITPTVQANYQKYAAPYVEKGVKQAQQVFTDTVVPAAGAVVGSALSVWDAANDTRAKMAAGRGISVDLDALARNTKKNSKKAARTFAAQLAAAKPEPKKSGMGAGGVIAILFGIAAAVGVLYAAWQTLRADDELWVADDPLRAPDA